MTTERDGTRPDPPLLRSLAYLVMNLPIGIASFVFVVTTVSVGLGTVIIWVGLAVLAVAILSWRGFAQFERARVHAMLGTYVATPYRPPPKQGKRWATRVKDPATWKDLVYCVLLLPIGIAEFTLMVTFWATSLWLVTMPIYWTWLPDAWRPILWNDHPLFAIDSWPDTLLWCALGVLVLAVAVALTRVLGTLHARFARALLGPSERRIDKLERLSTAGAIDWSSEWPHTTNTMYRPVSR
ncbi:sensor domain-containing protein [Actinophytocola sp.]|uniref:sensor domain-containing protein n=1 Tax=Actinophytocola sp. TaxID=1872138 RepID=UPI003D6A09DD